VLEYNRIGTVHAPCEERSFSRDFQRPSVAITSVPPDRRTVVPPA
jgi:hypothetical protein